MDTTDDKVNLTGNIPTESSRPIRLGDAVISRPHICGFFNSHDDEFRIAIPFISEGLEKGEKAFHTVDPQGRDEHLQRLASAGIDVTARWPVANSRCTIGTRCICVMVCSTSQERLPVGSR